MRYLGGGLWGGGLLLFAVIGLSLPSEALGDQLTIGTADGSLCIPFGCTQAADPTRFQQLYDSSLFGKALTITAIEFSTASAGSLTTGTYDITLSTSSAEIDDPDPGFYSLLPGPSSTVLSVTQANGAAPASLLLTFDTPYYYDPGDGNLLLDINVTDILNSFPPAAFFDAMVPPPDSNGLFSIRHDFGGTQFNGYGLVTTFEVTFIPEPSTFLLVATGLLGLGVRRGRRR